MAVDLSLAGVGRDSALHDLPEWVLGLTRVVPLDEIESTRPIGRTTYRKRSVSARSIYIPLLLALTSERIPHSSRTSSNTRPIRQRERIIRHIHIRMQAPYRSRYGGEVGGGHERLGSGELVGADDDVGTEAECVVGEGGAAAVAVFGCVSTRGEERGR